MVRRSDGGRHRRSRSLADLHRRSRRTGASALRVMRDLGEMNAAAAHTITHRGLLMARAACDPARLADPELSLMVTEKMEAAVAVAAAVMPQLAMPGLHATRWAGDCAALMARSATHATVATATSFPSPRAAWGHWSRLAEGMALINAAYGAAMLATMVDLGRVALAPVHKAATANAVRLGR